MVWLPKWVARHVSPVPFLIDDFVTAVAKEISSGSIVLDAGAGECQYAPLFSHCLYVSVDFAKGDSQWNYKRLSIIGDILSLPLKNRSVDVALCTQTLEHVNNPGILLEELFRVLKPGGQLFLTAPLGWPIHQPPHDFFRYTSYGLECLFRRTGFNVESIRPQGGYFFYLANCLQHMHRLLFPHGRPLSKRILLSPLQFLVALFASLLGPMVLYPLDRLDQKQDFTLNYECRCRKKASTS